MRAAYYSWCSWQHFAAFRTCFIWWKHPVKCPKGVYSFASNCCNEQIRSDVLYHLCSSEHTASAELAVNKTFLPLFLMGRFKFSQVSFKKNRILSNLKLSLTQLKQFAGHLCLQLKALIVFREILIPIQNEELLRIACPHTYQVSYNTWQLFFHAIFQASFLNSKDLFVVNGGYVDNAQQVGFY